MVGIIILLFIFYIETDAIANCAKIQKGTYVGTGSYGENNPTSITFTSKPNVVLINGHAQDAFGAELITTNAVNRRNLIIIDMLTSNYVNFISTTENGYMYIKYDSTTNTLSWFYGGSYTGTDFQMNSKNCKYYWAAW